MSKRIVIAMFMLLTLLGFVGPAGAQVVDGPSAGPEGCADFLTQGEAQIYFENGGGTAGDDVLNLDPDGNGIACDQPGVGPGGPSAGPEGCADFLTQAEAQISFENGGGTAGDDVLNLDSDGNGIACDESGVDTDAGDNAPVVSALPSTGSGVDPQHDAFAVTVIGATSVVLAALALAIRRSEAIQP